MKRGDSAQDREQRYRQNLEFWSKREGNPYYEVMAGICEIQLGSYVAARERCARALQGFLRERRFWLMVSRPELLVETLVMAGVSSPWDAEVAREVNGYKLDTRGSSPVAHYAYALVALVEHAYRQTEPHVAQLTHLKKDLWLSAIGRTIAAISERDQQGFDAALTSLLEAHKRMAKFGSIRESPEGFLSLAAMSLSKQALDRDMTIEMQSEYLSIGYLQYLTALA